VPGEEVYVRLVEVPSTRPCRPARPRVGPILASFDDQDAGLFRNYAVPDDGVEPTSN